MERSFLGLGVTDDKLQFPLCQHCQSRFQYVWLYSRFLHFSSVFTIIQAFWTFLDCLVENILEYCSVIWSSFRDCDCLTIEVVVGKFNRFLFFYCQRGCFASSDIIFRIASSRARVGDIFWCFFCRTWQIFLLRNPLDSFVCLPSWF